MEDHSVLIVQLEKQRDSLRSSLDSAGAHQRLVQRGKLEGVERQLRAMRTPAAAAPAGSIAPA